MRLNPAHAKKFIKRLAAFKGTTMEAVWNGSKGLRGNLYSVYRVQLIGPYHSKYGVNRYAKPSVIKEELVLLYDNSVKQWIANDSQSLWIKENLPEIEIAHWLNWAQFKTYERAGSMFDFTVVLLNPPREEWQESLATFIASVGK